MVKSITTSPKAAMRKNSAQFYDFSKVLQDIPEMNKNINKRIQRYEECQSLSLQKASQIHSR